MIPRFTKEFGGCCVLTSCVGTLLVLSTVLVVAHSPAFAQGTNNTPHWLGRNGIYKMWGHNISERLRQAAEQRDPNAMYGMFVMNDTTENDFSPYTPEAMHWLMQAAEAGHPEAEVLLGFSLENRIKPNDMPHAIHWYRLSAGQNHPGGEYRLALCCLRGAGVEQDEEQGIELLRQSADQGHLWALTRLADAYARGIGVPRDERDRPVNLLLRAGKEGFEPACDALVTRYKAGLGADRDFVTASKWYCRGAESLSPRFPLNKAMSNGPQTSEFADNSFDMVLFMFCHAVIRHETGSMMQIGTMYADGRDVPQSPSGAWQWFNYAAAEGAPGAATRRAEMEHRMTAEELADAKAQANAFGAELAGLANQLRRRGVAPE